MKKFWTYISELIFPSEIKCIFCDAELNEKTPPQTCTKCLKLLPYKDETEICHKCGDKIEGWGKVCLICKRNVRHFEKAVSPFYYEQPINVIIRKLKYNGAKYLFYPLASFMAAEYFKHNFDVDGVVFVPMMQKAEKTRGYNQANLLAKEFCKITGLELFEDAVQKVKVSSKQVGLALSERKKNVEKTFSVNKKLVKEKSFLVIDDVLTSGATVNEISRVLIGAGATKVFVLTLARTHFSKNKQKENLI